MSRCSSCTLSYLIFFLLLLHSSFGLNLDGTLLLSLKYSILSDPLSVLDNWDYADATPCLWRGVQCAQVEEASEMFRVTSLALPSSELLGSIPEDIGLIQHLHTLDLSNNFFNGTLPYSLFNASEIQVLSLSNNAISGSVPEISGLSLEKLRVLNLSNNALAGKFPWRLTSLQNLTVVDLRSNYLSGTIPGGFDSVEALDLSSNLFNGSLPDEFGGESLRYLNLSSNKLSGVVSLGFAKKIPDNATIDLSFNNLTGKIPDSMALSNQETESFAGNMELCGKPLKKLCSIPSILSNPPHDPSSNTSSPAIAAIPKTFNTAPSPDSTQTSSDSSQHGLKPGAIAGIAVGDLAGVGLLLLLVLFVYQSRKKKSKRAETRDTGTEKDYYKQSSITISPTNINPSSAQKDTRSVSTWSCLTIKNGEEETSDFTSSETEENNNNNNNNENCHEVKYEKERALVMMDGESEVELETLFKASAYVLGSSGGSIVYKAVLQDGSAFAVRRIGECGVGRLKDFENQVKAIAKMRHRNLVRVRGFYWGDDEKLVIFEYVSNGSLENAGYRKIGSSPYHLPYEVRLKIATGVARALSYIHEKKHVHGNIKPSNILWTQEMEPVISDFGHTWLLHGKNNNTTRKSDGSGRHFGSKRCTSADGFDHHHHHHSINGSPYIAPAGFVGCTSPYHAPESLDNVKPNPKWDVYSFGVLLLELITGKVFSDRELSQWTTTGSVNEDKGRVLRMADVAMRGDVASREEDALALFKLGFSCASLVPQKRPCMKDALQVLEKIPRYSSH